MQDLDHTQRPEPDTSNARDAGEMRVHPALSCESEDVNGIVWPTNAEEQQITLTDTNKDQDMLMALMQSGYP